MELVLGVSMAPASIRLLLVEGENADGATVEEDNLKVATADEAPTLSAADQVIDAIMGTREGAAQTGSRLMSTGVTWTDNAEAAALRDALAARKVENVMLVSAFLAAAALAHTVGNAIGYQHTAMLFVEPDTATLAVVDSTDGSVTDVYRRALRGGPGADAVTQLIAMIVGVHALPSRPGGVFVVGSGVDVAPIKRGLEAATRLTVIVPEEPEMALARGAALASANAPLFASSTAALAYAQDPGTGAVDPYAVAPRYLAAHDAAFGTGLGVDELLAYSAVPDEEADAETVILDRADEWVSGLHHAVEHVAAPQRRPILLTGSALAATVVTAAALALVITLAINIRTTVALRPVPGQALIVPAAQPPAPAPALAEAPAIPAAPLHLPVAPPVPARAAIAPPLNPPAPAAPVLPAAPIPAAPPVIVAPVPIAPMPVPARIPAPAPPVWMPIPQVPLHLPDPQSPIQVQAPQPVHLPAPPQQRPFPAPQQGPFPAPEQGPFPRPQQGPFQQQHLPSGQPPGGLAPQAPRHLPASEPPRSLPEPQSPRFPTMPQPQAPRVPTMPEPQAPRVPTMPEPQAPRVPTMPEPQAPRFPTMPEPQAPRMPAPAMPHLSVPHFRL